MWSDTLAVDIDGLTLFSGPLPSSGAVLAYILNTLENYAFAADDLDEPVTYQRVAETFKFAYAKRAELGDPFDSRITEFVNEVRTKI